jgi:hypothetical protein
MAKRTYTYDGSEWVGLASPSVDVSNYANLTTYQPTFRNVLRNAEFSVDQRNAGASQTITAGAALAYTVDRWYAYCTGANITGARVTGNTPSQYAYRFTGATSNTAVGFGQRIEASNSFHLANQNVTLSVNIASTSLTSITWTAFYANTTDTFGTLASPTRTQIATGTFAVTSTVSRKTASFAVPSAATTGIEIVFTGGALLGSQTLTYDDAQLELGSVSTPFEHRPIGLELMLCKRYYEKSYPYTVVPGTAGAWNTNTIMSTGKWSNALDFRHNFTVEKFRVPDMVFYNPVGGSTSTLRIENMQINNTDYTYNLGSQSYTTVGFMFRATMTSSTDYREGGSYSILHYTANAEL